MRAITPTVMWRVLLLVACVAARCRRFPAISTFNMDSYLGRWYLQYKYSNEVSLPMSQCWSWTYFRDDAGKLRLRTTYVNSLTDGVTNHQSRAWMKNPSQPSMLRVKLNYFLYNRNEDYQVIATDYSNFTIEYQCSGSNLLDKRETVWLLTRDQQPQPQTLERAFSALTQLGMGNVDMQREYQRCSPSPEVARRRTGRRGPGFVQWLVGGSTSRAGRPSLWQWMTGGNSRPSGNRRRGTRNSGLLSWLGF